jgi:predicted nucleic acid-binding protein
LVVVDSSALLDYILGNGTRAAWVEGQLDEAEWNLHAPHLIDIEAAAVMRRLERAGELPAEHGRAGIELMHGFRLVRYPHVRLLGRIWELRHNLTASDAAYAALAETLDVPLVTTDERLARAPGIHIDVLAP